MPEFGFLHRVDLRHVWPHESANFTPWLAENLSALNEAIGFDLELTGIEAAVGDFSLDLLAKDLGTGRNVIIENQLTPTNHDHLGKLLTYAAAYDAVAVIWIAESIRDEHRQALEWLNLRAAPDVGFFAIVVEVLQIDTSKPAFNFRPVVFPNEGQRRREAGGKNSSVLLEAYRNFFQPLIDELREKHRFTAARVSQPQSSYAFATGFSGAKYSVAFKKGGKRIGVELYIDLGDFELTKALFDRLLAEKKSIEAAFGEPLEWERLDQRRACRVVRYLPGSIRASPEELAGLRKMIVSILLKLKEAVGPVLAKHATGGLTTA